MIGSKKMWNNVQNLRIRKHYSYHQIRNFSQQIGVNRTPAETDILIIGGGAIGSSIAYWLKEKSINKGVNKGVDVVVVEKDPSYTKCSTTRSMGGIRQQFCTPENIVMSLYSAAFLQQLKERFGPDADVNFVPYGYLILASKTGATQLEKNHKLQKQFGAENILLSQNQLKERYPWMNVDGVELGSLGLKNEGWFDPWALLSLFKNSAKEMGAHYVHGEVIGFTNKNEELKEVIVKKPDGRIKSVKFNSCVMAAGCESGDVAKLIRIGTGEGLLTFPIPVEKRKRYIFRFDVQGENPPGLITPKVFDYTGVYFRRDGTGGAFLGGKIPARDQEPDTGDLEVDYNYFEERMWELLAHRVPAFGAVKVQSAWAGYYEFNSFDENGIIGLHSYYKNLYISTGFSGHGIQKSPAVGRAVAELILDGRFKTIDVSRLGFDRLIRGEPVYESEIY